MGSFQSPSKQGRATVYMAPRDGGAEAAWSLGVLMDGAEAAARCPPWSLHVQEWVPKPPGSQTSHGQCKGPAPPSVTREDSVCSELVSSAAMASGTAWCDHTGRHARC